MFEKFRGIAHLMLLKYYPLNCRTKLKRILNVQSELAKDDSIHIINNIKGNFQLEKAEVTNTEDADFKKKLKIA